MSKKAKTESKNKFVYTPTQKLPQINSIKTSWDLKKHFYKNVSDPQLEKDAEKYITTCKKFIRKYKNKNFTSTKQTLLLALKDYESLEKRCEASKIFRYLSFRLSLNTNDTEAHKKLNLFSDRFSKLSNELLFFGLKLGQVPAIKQRKFLTSVVLSKYHYFLKLAFQAGKHQLSEEQEAILNLRSRTSNEMWCVATEKIVSNRTIVFNDKTLHLPEASETLETLQGKDKPKLWRLITTELKQIGEYAEHEITAVVTHKKVTDELRNYKKPYSATVQSYENDEKSVEALVEAISTKGFDLSKKFYKLKAQLHNKKKIEYANKYDPIGKLIEPDFKTSAEICRDVFYSVKNEYGAIFDTMLKNGQIDVYPKPGKRGGAFMSGTIGLPTFIFLNHTNDFKSLETLAHEMGHAIHGERSKLQPEIYQDFSTTTAETASTLFEQLVLDRIYQQLNAKQKIAFLHTKLTRDIATVQRQIACFNFELEMHTHIRQQGLATNQELAKMMQKHMQSYLGSAVNVTEEDGYSYVSWSHIRYGFYVYTYTYGHLISNLMAHNYQKSSDYLSKIDEFLTSGANASVEDIFKRIGINTRKVDTFIDSLERQEEEIANLRKLTT